MASFESRTLKCKEDNQRSQAVVDQLIRECQELTGRRGRTHSMSGLAGAYRSRTPPHYQHQHHHPYYSGRTASVSPVRPQGPSSFQPTYKPPCMKTISTPISGQNIQSPFNNSSDGPRFQCNIQPCYPTYLQVQGGLRPLRYSDTDIPKQLARNAIYNPSCACNQSVQQPYPIPPYPLQHPYPSNHSSAELLPELKPQPTTFSRNSSADQLTTMQADSSGGSSDIKFHTQFANTVRSTSEKAFNLDLQWPWQSQEQYPSIPNSPQYSPQYSQQGSPHSQQHSPQPNSPQQCSPLQLSPQQSMLSMNISDSDLSHINTGLMSMPEVSMPMPMPEVSMPTWNPQETSFNNTGYPSVNCMTKPPLGHTVSSPLPNSCAHTVPKITFNDNMTADEQKNSDTNDDQSYDLTNLNLVDIREMLDGIQSHQIQFNEDGSEFRFQ